ncbi:MAG TPA: hypothetical protein PLY23_09210 [Alphaproteobacteria bacterium]|nr:hypothetical protein [Alphaproteobacteria bacterium]HQS94783.1 hypothetical protein [Alphaproteobacteria bacterium]
MKLSKIFKMSTALGILGSLFLSSSSYGMMAPSSYEVEEVDGRPILTVTQIKQESPADEEAQGALLERFSKMSAAELEALPKTKTEYDIGYAPEEFEKAFDSIFRGLVNSVTLRSGKEVRFDPFRGGKGEFLEWVCGPSLHEKRFLPSGFLEALSDRARFLRDGLSTFCQVVTSRHALNAGAVVTLDEVAHRVSLTSFKGFSAENPLDGFKSEKDHLSGLTWWIMSDGVRVGFVQAVIKSIYEGASSVTVPLQVRSKFGIFPSVDFSGQDRDDVENFFEKKMRDLNGSKFAAPRVREEGSKVFLSTAAFTYTKIPSAGVRSGKDIDISVKPKEHDITPQMYPDQRTHFNRIFGPLEGVHELSVGKKIMLTPLVGGRQFEQFGHFFGENPSEAAENFAKALHVRNDFFVKELMLITEMPTHSTGDATELMPVSKFSAQFHNGLSTVVGKITSQRTKWEGLMWLVQTEGGEPLGTVRVNETSSSRHVSVGGLDLGYLYDPAYSLSFSLPGHFGQKLDMDYDAARIALFNIFESKWWTAFKPVITEMPIL